jgi:ribulose-5-phosphate 4-epimerase/fuculose-1-phosphate aldolase
MPPIHESVEDERRHRRERLAGALRIFGRHGFEDGVSGHITARDPEYGDCFWVNPFGMPFKHIR